ncbi:MAG: CHAT domain-containing protein [Pseudomonadota bacterium]
MLASLFSFTSFAATETIQSLLEQAHTYRANGLYEQAEIRACQARDLAGQQPQGILKAESHYVLAEVLLARQQLIKAQTAVNTGLKHATESDATKARLLHLQGNIAYLEENYADALAAYRESAVLASKHDNHMLWIRTSNSQSRVHIKQGQFDNAEALLTRSLAAAYTLRNPTDEAFQLLAVADLYLGLPEERWDRHLKALNQLNTRVIEITGKRDRFRAMAYTYQARLYQHAEQIPTAKKLLRQAIFISSEQPDLLYLWEWQLGQLFQAEGDINNAVASYRRATTHLQKIRSGLLIGQQDSKAAFRERIQPIYYDLADVLLQQARYAEASDKQPLLRDAIDVLEPIKTEELQDYFQDECVTDALERVQTLRPDKTTAILYPVALPDRLVILLERIDGIQQIEVQVTDKEFADTIKSLRYELVNRVSRRFAGYSRVIYDWLILPLEPHLDGVKTLVIVPDEHLRQIPPAALHSGKQYLLENYALVITPALQLTDPGIGRQQNIRMSLNGLSTAVQGFTPLPAVENEIAQVQGLFTSDVLLNSDFIEPSFQNNVSTQGYNIIHIASHGVFGDQPEDTYLLTHDATLDMNELSQLLKTNQIQQERLELLTLSACETAVGSDRAALGLAGVAIKTGARSALASLWKVDDIATSKLMIAFYKNLKQPNISKAEAIRQAQLALLKQHQYRHPYYWSAMILIGNWL